MAVSSCFAGPPAGVLVAPRRAIDLRTIAEIAHESKKKSEAAKLSIVVGNCERQESTHWTVVELLYTSAIVRELRGRFSVLSAPECQMVARRPHA